MKSEKNYFIKSLPSSVKKKKKNEVNHAQKNMVTIVCPSRYKISRSVIKQAVLRYFKKTGVSSDYQLNVIFVGRTKMKTIAKDYKNKSLALPILSFPYNDLKNNLLGEIFICYPQAVLLAAERNKKVDYIIEQLIEHGIDNIIN